MQVHLKMERIRESFVGAPLTGEVTQGKHSNAKLPDLILLDVNLPKKNGHEVLQYIKGDEKLKRIPVIMLTTSSFKKDINLAYDNYANCYITKPMEVKDFINVVTTIENFWISIVNLPIK